MNKITMRLRNLFVFSWTLMINPVLLCDTGWFGSRCQFKCHCQIECSVTGDCTGSKKCARGWFGLKCQKQDLLLIENSAISSVPKLPTLQWLTDDDVTTCNTYPYLMSVTVTWVNKYVFTWMRYTVYEDVILNDILLIFYGPRDTTLTCPNIRILKLTNRLFEVHCDVPVPVQKMMIGGVDVSKICSMYINGGQNFALKVRVTESSSNTGMSLGYRAVDGDVSGDYNKKKCTHSKLEDRIFPSMLFQFPRSYLLTRIIVYNRDGVFGRRLKRFMLEAFDAKDARVLRYRENANTSAFQASYDVLNARNWKHPISEIEISQSEIAVNDSIPILTICEMEAYGECPPGTWNNECEECVKCYNRTCHQETGLCLQGCLGYSDPPLCTEPCHADTWGWNCTFLCISSYCLNKSCSKNTGICDRGCAPRYMDFPNCTVAQAIGLKENPTQALYSCMTT